MADDIKDAPASSDHDLLRPAFLNEPVKRTKTIGSSIYDLDYYSGAGQAALYIGDVFVDEVTSFSYSVQQSKMPIYGYASQLFDRVSHGTVLVQGQFSINFKESGYLWLVLHRYKRFQNTVDQTIEKYNQVPDQFTAVDVGGRVTKLPPSKRILGGRNVPFARFQDKNKEYDFISRAGIERLVSGEASRDERFSFYQNLAGYATISNPRAKDKVFEDIVEVFEDQVWQEDVSDLDDFTRRADDNFFDDFDMFCVFGDYSKPGANHTVKRIRNVHIMGQAQSIDNNGEPLQEIYTFCARNII
jgi:hypothetical protein